MTMAGSTYKVTLHDPARDSDEEIAEQVALGNAVQAEVLPGDPPTPVAQAIAVRRAQPASHRRWSFRAFDDQGRLAAEAGTSVDPDHDDNPDILQVQLNVAAGHRRRGIGSRLLSELVGVARQEHRSRMLSMTNERLAGGAAFAEQVGAAAKQKWHVNHLPLGEVDRPMLERWVAEAAQRAADYELIGWDGPVPDEHIGNWVDLVPVMNTAPLDDLQINDFTMTEARARQGERLRAAAGGYRWTLVARHRAGAWAGLHDVIYNPSAPAVVWVGMTGVRPEHRGHALGKWLKAAMTLRVLDERPEVAEIRTANADSNAAMLGINQTMGYRPLIAQTTWELSVDAAESWLRKRGVLAG
ncbi:MAG: GNAT family N-acetyltransferase [Actinobacteria bacterium]|nr:GNAT family N-acetyltransferase [Actinomycetota bacterium]